MATFIGSGIYYIALFIYMLIRLIKAKNIKLKNRKIYKV